MFSSWRKQTTDIPYKGLVNQGATCYLNSVLQVLFMTTDFREALQRSHSGSLDRRLKELFDDLKKYDGYTYNIAKALGITDGFVQADAAECFEKILRNMTNQEAAQIFQGVLTVKNKCCKCNTETCDDNPCWSLPLELVDSEAEYRVEDGISQYFCLSEVNGPDQLFCGDCNAKTDSTIKIELKHHPEVLTLLLKRFKFDYINMCYFKVKRRVEIPEYLEIQNQTYELYGFVEHHGNLKSGHYTATIQSQEDKRWYNFNDSRVDSFYQFYQLDKKETSQSAYLLFYRKISADDAMNEEKNKASVSESSETHRSETNKPHKCDETVKSETNCEMAESCECAKRREMEKGEEKFISVEREDDFRDQMKMSVEKEKDEENKPEDQAQAPKPLTKYDLYLTSKQSSGREGEHRVRSSERSQELDGENRRSLPLHEQQSNNKSTESQISPGIQTGRGSIQSSFNMEMAEIPREDFILLEKRFEDLDNDGQGQSREGPSSTSVKDDAGSRKNSCFQQRDDGRDAGNEQRNNVQLPQTGGTTLTNDGWDSGSVQSSGTLYRSSISISLQNQSSGKKIDFVTKRTQNEDILYVLPKRKCNGETDDQQYKHDDERTSERDGRYEATLNRPASSSEDRKERTNKSNVEKTRESEGSCDRLHHQTEHSKIIQQDATSGFNNASQHCHVDQNSTNMTPVHTVPLNSDSVSHLTQSVKEWTLTDRQTHEDVLTNTPVKTEGRGQQMLSSTHYESSYNPESPIPGHSCPTSQNSQSNIAHPHFSSRQNMPVKTEGRGQQMLSNSHYRSSYNPESPIPGHSCPTYQNSQSHIGHNMPAENVTAPIGGSVIPTVFGSSVHYISAPPDPAGLQLGSGIRTTTEILRRETQTGSSHENTERGSSESQAQVITEDSADLNFTWRMCGCLYCKTHQL